LEKHFSTSFKKVFDNGNNAYNNTQVEKGMLLYFFALPRICQYPFALSYTFIKRKLLGISFTKR
jgi:hypothetical protein